MGSGSAPSGPSHRPQESGDERSEVWDGALTWLSERLDLFDPFLEGAEADMFRVKASLELAVMCWLAAETGIRDARLHVCLDPLGDAWRRPELHERMLRRPGRIRLYLMLYLALQRCGRAGPELMPAVGRILDAGYATAVEEVPFRTLDLRYMLDLAGLPAPVPAIRDGYRQTLAARTDEMVDLTDYDLYCLTHALFYLTDFGRTPATAIAPDQLDALRYRVGLLLGTQVLAGNWDLTGELLIACDCLRHEPACRAAAWRAFAAAQQPDGAIPGPEWPATEVAREDRRRRDFELNYHTTLVGALAVVTGRRASA
jgi:hypothetical protein